MVEEEEAVFAVVVEGVTAEVFIIFGSAADGDGDGNDDVVLRLAGDSLSMSGRQRRARRWALRRFSLRHDHGEESKE